MPRTTKNTANDSRETIYPKIILKLCQGKTALTVAQAKKLLGWSEASDDAKDYQFKDQNGKKIVCTNNPSNRPLGLPDAHKYSQELLRSRWRLNCENIIIGLTGLILNGQHRLIGFVLACQLLENNAEWYKDEYDIEGPLTMETSMAFGVSEDDDTVNTMDTCKPRSLADVIYRAGYFSSFSSSQRKKVARALDYAVRLLWHRTGVDSEAYAPKRTHAEAIDFINRHPGLIKCVKHIHEENGDGDNRIGLLLSQGSAAGLMYLMSCSESDSQEYREAGYKENSINFTLTEEAEEFWTLVATSEDFKPLRTSMAAMIDDGDSSSLSRVSMIVNAWNLHINEKKLTAASLKPRYTTDADTGARTLKDIPSVGGIDLGDPSKEDVVPEAEEESPKPQGPSENAIADGSKVYVLDDSQECGYWVGELAGTFEGLCTVISDTDGEPYGEIPIDKVLVNCPE